MKCKVCGAESGKYPLCRACNAKKEKGEIIKCEKCGNWHLTNVVCNENNSISENCNFLYSVKETLISKSEQSFYSALKSSVPEGYSVFPQINLAAFIDKNDNATFRNELFRNVDFLITNAEYAPQIVVEINDYSHLENNRKKRDEKVQKICEEAGVPILKLWTSYGVNQEYIKAKIDEILNKLPIERIHHFNQDSKEITVEQSEVSDNLKVTKRKNGCYVATCVYGSYDCPEVWVLRRYRDNILHNTFFGRLFIKIYYLLSPLFVKVFGKKTWFISFCKAILDKIISKLLNNGFENTPYADKY